MALLITEEVLYEYNVDGTHGKKRFKDFKNLYTCIEGNYKHTYLQRTFIL